MSKTDHGHPLLASLALRVRRLRRVRGWTRGQLAGLSGLSVRFLARVESAEGNISVLRLEALAGALSIPAFELLLPLADPDRLIVLVGLRGAGKSTVGPLLARRLDVPFIEMDRLIVEACGLPLDQLFELHGEAYYRRLERETLRRILGSGQRAVVAAAGGIVNEPAAWRMLREQAAVVWLKATPEEHWTRVLGQGDRRPMADNPDAMDELRALWAARERVYAEARITIDTGAGSAAETAEAIDRRLAAGR